jgi:hypothetical protein
MIWISVKLITINCVFLKVKMTVTIGESLYYLYIGKIVIIYSVTFESLVFFSGNCKIAHVTICVILLPSSIEHGIPLVFQNDNP